MSVNGGNSPEWSQAVNYSTKHGYTVINETPTGFQLDLDLEATFECKYQYMVDKVEGDGYYEVALFLGTDSVSTLEFLVTMVGRVVLIVREYELDEGEVVKATYKLTEDEDEGYEMECLHGHVLQHHRAYSIEMLKADSYTAFDVGFMMLHFIKKEGL